MQPSLSFLRKHLILISLARGLIFWYAIEKLFEVHIGMTAQQIVLVGVLAQGSKVLFELPTSVFADRWNRRNMLLAAEALMILCSIILGTASSITGYIIGALVWALSDALASGVLEAFAYDSLKATGNTSHFKKVYTRMTSCHLVSLAVAGVVAGVLSMYFNLRVPFFLATIPLLFSMVLLLRLKEPPLKRTTEMAMSWVGHIGGAFKIMAGSKLRWPATIYISLFGFLHIWFEYYQLVGIDIKLGSFLFGLLITILTLGMAVGSEIAHHRGGTKRIVLLVWLVLMVTHLVGLRFGTPVAAFISLFITFVALQLQGIYLSVHVQDNIPSERRATIMSIMSTMGYVWFFALAGLFVLVLEPLGIRGALSIASLPMLVLGAIDLARGLPWAHGKRSTEPLDDELGVPKLA